MTRTLDEILADAPDWSDLDTMIAFADDVLEGKLAPQVNRTELYADLGAATGVLQSLGTTVKALLQEWKSEPRGGEYGRGVARIEAIRAELAADRNQVDYARTKLKAEGYHHPDHKKPSPSIRVLRQIDLLAEHWRDDETRAAETMEAINQVLAEFFEEGMVPE